MSITLQDLTVHPAQFLSETKVQDTEPVGFSAPRPSVAGSGKPSRQIPLLQRRHILWSLGRPGHECHRLETTGGCGHAKSLPLALRMSNKVETGDVGSPRTPERATCVPPASRRNHLPFPRSCDPHTSCLGPRPPHPAATREAVAAISTPSLGQQLATSM